MTWLGNSLGILFFLLTMKELTLRQRGELREAGIIVVEDGERRIATKVEPGYEKMATKFLYEELDLAKSEKWRRVGYEEQLRKDYEESREGRRGWLSFLARMFN